MEPPNTKVFREKTARANSNPAIRIADGILENAVPEMVEQIGQSLVPNT